MSGDDTDEARRRAQENYQINPLTPKVEDYQVQEYWKRDAYNAELERQRQAEEERRRR
jgi:superfamily I DNA and RNA helicase